MTLDATDRDILLTALAAPESGWSLGAFGAGAEFRRRPDEPFSALGDGRTGLRTGRGGIALALPETVRPVAYEMPVGDGWSHAVALCLSPASFDAAPCTQVTELAPDADALDPARRGAPCFDLGLGLAQASVRIRSERAATLDRLRAHLGAAAPDFDAVIRPEVAAGHADLLVVGPLGRIEVLGGHSDPFGPRAFVVPKLLRRRRSHVATAPIPPGLIPAAHLYPPHPCRDETGRPCPFDPARHEAFQILLRRWGDRSGLALKAALAAGARPHVDRETRWTRAVARVTHAQARHLAHRG